MWHDALVLFTSSEYLRHPKKNKPMKNASLVSRWPQTLAHVIGPICLVAIAAAISPAHAQTLVPKWQNSAVGDPINRDMAYNPATGNLLLVKNTAAVLRFNSVDGTSAGADLDTNGVSGGTFRLSGIAVLADGTIFGCNYVTGAQSTSPLKIYQWSSEAGTPTLLTSLGTLPGTTASRFGAMLRVFTTATTTNFLIAGTTVGLFARFDGTTWTFKELTVDAQVFTPCGTFIDYNAPGFANKFRVVAKSRGSGGQLYNFDPTAASPINLTAGKVAMTGAFSFVANGVTTHGYDPVTKLLAGTTSTLQASPWPYTNIICNAASSVSGPTETSRVMMNATGADGGQASATVWGTDGRLYTSVAALGAGINAFDITAFLVSAPDKHCRSGGRSQRHVHAGCRREFPDL